MRYCKNCGKMLEDDENFCKSCGTKQDGGYEDVFEGQRTYNNTPYYDENPPRQLSKGVQTFIKILLILTILGIVLTAGRYLISGLTLTGDGLLDAVFGEMAADPEFDELFASIDADQLEQVVKTLAIVYAIFQLIPLCWVLPMSKKIRNAMKNGDTLTTGFKVCTLIFVNLILGIVLLCQKDI